MIREKEDQPTAVEVKPVVKQGSVWIDDSHESLLQVRVALETKEIPNAVGLMISKYRDTVMTVDVETSIYPDRFTRIYPSPDVNAELLAALKACFKPSLAPYGPSCPLCHLEITGPNYKHSEGCLVGSAIAKAEGGAQ